MTALLDPPAVLGVQIPRILWPPDPPASSLGADAVKFARSCGIELFPWQEFALERMLGQDAAGRWVAPTFGLTMPRQNGKSVLLLIRELYGLIELGERKALHTAHHGRTVKETWKTAVALIKSSPVLDGLVPNRPGQNGHEAVGLASGAEIAFLTRTALAGRGMSAQVITFDEAQHLDHDEVSALMYTVSAQSQLGNPQTIYAGSAGDHRAPAMAGIRRSGMAGDNRRLAYLEWSIDDDAYLAASLDEREAIATDPAQWAVANPLLGIRISVGQVEDEQHTGEANEFAKERLGVGHWPLDELHDWLIPRAKWAACSAPESSPPVGAVALAVGAAWDRTVSVGVCGARADGLILGELTHYGAGPVVAIVKEVIRLRDTHRPCVITVDDKGPADFLIAPLEAAGVVLERLSVRDVAAATSGLHAACTESDSGFRHRGQPEVSAALAGARRKDVGDGWVLDRRRSAADVTPLEVLALARWGFVKFGAVAHQSWGFFE